MGRRFLYVLLAIPSACRADNAILGSGFSSTSYISVAPGQILALVVQGIGASLTQTVSAGSLPLPLTLAGITVNLQQYSTSGATLFHLFMVSVQPIPCAFATSGIRGLPACAPVTRVTVQIPYEIAAPGQTTGDPTAGQLTVYENGNPGTAVSVLSASDQVHIVTVVHPSDWSPVGVFNAASAGEHLVMFAYGLGAVSPGAPTGGAAPNPPATPIGAFKMNYDFRPDAPPWPYGAGGLLPSIRPSFIGLTPGLPGLYQINFQAPAPPGPITPCANPSIPPEIFAGSNVTLNLVGSSFDGFGICVTPPQP